MQFLSKQSWTGTYRDLASAMGLMLWFHRVHDRKLIDIQDFMALYEASYPGPNPSDWDKEASLDDAQFNTLKKHAAWCKSNNFTPFKRPLSLSTKVFAATDASSFGYGWCFKIDQHVMPLRISTPAHHDRGSERIHLAELEAIRLMIQDVDNFCSRHQLQIPNVFVVACDSNVAMGMIKRGYAKKEMYRRELQTLFQILGDRRISFKYVDTTKNPADAPSRDLPFNNNLWEELLPVIETQAKRAVEQFCVTGSQVHHDRVRKQREEDPAAM
jgi:hypothetical protein